MKILGSMFNCLKPIFLENGHSGNLSYKVKNWSLSFAERSPSKLTVDAPWGQPHDFALHHWGDRRHRCPTTGLKL
jgi:hypothetical protein